MTEKTARRMTAPAARALEGLVGGTLGGAFGGAVGALAYEPTEPREWMDAQGNIYDRPLSSEEKKTRLAVATASALAGALGGAGLSMGGSGVLRARLAGAERKAAKRVAAQSLLPLQHLIEDYQGIRNARLAVNPKAKSNPYIKGLNKRINIARTLLQQEQKALEGLVDEAAKRRATIPFTGGLPRTNNKGTGVDWRPMTHQGVVQDHLDAIAKKHGEPKLNLLNAYDVFEKAVESRMSKTAAAAFYAELRRIVENG